MRRACQRLPLKIKHVLRHQGPVSSARFHPFDHIASHDFVALLNQSQAAVREPGPDNPNDGSLTLVEVIGVSLGDFLRLLEIKACVKRPMDCFLQILQPGWVDGKTDWIG